jgi:hypothetical protein
LVLYNGEPRWAAPTSLGELIGLPQDSRLWRWQPELSYHILDEGAFSEDDLAARDALTALLFRLENSPDPEQVVVLTNAVIAWLARHPGYGELKSAFIDFLAAMMDPLSPGMRVPEDLLEVRNMLASRAENWKQQWLQEGELKGRQEGELKGELRGILKGESALLIRLLERRFGSLPDWAQDRIAAADAPALEEWSLRVLDAASLDEVLS